MTNCTCNCTNCPVAGNRVSISARSRAGNCSAGFVCILTGYFMLLCLCSSGGSFCKLRSCCGDCRELKLTEDIFIYILTIYPTNKRDVYLSLEFSFVLWFVFTNPVWQKCCCVTSQAALKKICNVYLCSLEHSSCNSGLMPWESPSCHKDTRTKALSW
jgi:hypothetical protein